MPDIRSLLCNDQGEGETYCGRLTAVRSHRSPGRGGFVLEFDYSVAALCTWGFVNPAAENLYAASLVSLVRLWDPDYSEPASSTALGDALREGIGLLFAVDVVPHRTRNGRFFTTYAWSRV